MSHRVKDDVERHRFELEDNGATAFATYRRAGGAVTVVHTEVPNARQGRGIGSALAKGILEQLQANGEKLIPECRFIAAYVRKHPEYQDLLARPLSDSAHPETDAMLDEALNETFPASDPTAVTARD